MTWHQSTGLPAFESPRNRVFPVAKDTSISAGVIVSGRHCSRHAKCRCNMRVVALTLWSVARRKRRTISIGGLACSLALLSPECGPKHAWLKLLQRLSAVSASSSVAFRSSSPCIAAMVMLAAESPPARDGPEAEEAA